MVTIPFLLIVSVFMIIIIGTYMMNSIIPFIYHQKLITIANKYMFVIEKFGYLTEEEKSLLNNELITSGFDISKISLKYPSELKEYGQLIELEIDYTLVLKTPIISNGTYGSIEKETILKVKKNSFSKI
jgi:lipopolysaccharide/colanic/teichoic acid biosynthesis glycosyltransferase